MPKGYPNGPLKLSPKLCKSCRKLFKPPTRSVRYCSYECARAINGYGDVNEIAWHINDHGYFCVGVTFGGKRFVVFQHRWLEEKRLGRLLQPDEVVHHLDELTLNNDSANLQRIDWGDHTRHHNLTREYPNKLPRGVSPNQYAPGFRAKIGWKGKQLNIGVFDTPEEAHQAYLTKRRELYGEE